MSDLNTVAAAQGWVWTQSCTSVGKACAVCGDRVRFSHWAKGDQQAHYTCLPTVIDGPQPVQEHKLLTPAEQAEEARRRG